MPPTPPPHSESAKQASPAETDAQPNTNSSETSLQARDFQESTVHESQDDIQQLGPYRIVRVLGKGGMGAVYQAEDTTLKRNVALKVMLPRLAANPQSKRRFLREAEAQAAVEHDHIIAIYQVGEDAGVPFIAMPLLKGLTLADGLKQRPIFPLSHIVRIGREIADGLAAAHAAGLIHRDIKPGNIWLEGKKLRVKILDFGLARAQVHPEGEEQLTADGAIVGTPAYMSPEQARGEAVDHRSDLFSLGVILYQMATGEQAFRGPNAMVILTQLAMLEPPPVQSKNPDIPARLADLIHRLLAKDVNVREPSAAAVVAELRAIEKELARPITGQPAGTEPQIVYVPIPLAMQEFSPFAEIDATSPTIPTSSPKTETPKQPSRKPPPILIGSLVFGVLALLLGGVIVIRITNKDGSVTELKVPEGSKVEVEQGGQRTTVAGPGKQQPPVTAKPKTNPPKVDPLPPMEGIDHAAERKAAEALAKIPGVSIELLKGDGTTTTIRDGQLPDERFAVYGISAQNIKAFDDAAMAHLTDCRVLTNFNAGGTSITDAGLKHLSQLQTLRTLRLEGCRDAGDGIAEVMSISPDLREIGMNGTRATAQTLAALQTCPHVSVLHIELFDKLTEEDLAGVVKHCPRIEDMHIESDQNPISLTPLAGLKQLRKLFCPGDMLTAEFITLLAQLPRFEQLTITTPTTEAVTNLKPLAEKLKRLIVYSNSTKDKGLTAAGHDVIADLTALESLRLEFNDGLATDADLARLAMLPRLSALQLVQAGHAEPKPAHTAAGVAEFRRLRPDVHLVIDYGMKEDYPPQSKVENTRDPVPPKVAKLKGPPVLVGKGQPLAPHATVSRPAAIPGVRSWSIELAGHLGFVQSITWSPKGDVIATGGERDLSVRLWDRDGNLMRVLLGHEGRVTSVAFSSDGALLASADVVVGGSNHSLRIWDVASGACKAIVPLPLWNARITYSPDGKLLAVSGAFGKVFVLTLADGTVREIQTKGENIFALGWSPDSLQLLVASGSDTLRVYEITSGQMTTTLHVPTEIKGRNFRLMEATWSPDGQWIAGGGTDGNVHIWNARTHEYSHKIDTQIDIVAMAAWNNESKLIAATGNGGGTSFQIFDAMTGTLKASGADGLGELPSVAWSPSGQKLAVVSNSDGQGSPPVICDSQTGQALHKWKKNRVYTGSGTLQSQDLLHINPAQSKVRRFDSQTGQLLDEFSAPNRHVILNAPGGQWRAYFGNDECRIEPVKGEPVTYVVPGQPHWWDAHPSSDRLAGAIGQQVFVWDTATGQQRYVLEHPARVSLSPSAQAWSPNGKQILTAAADKVLRLWDADSGKLLRTFERFPQPPDGMYGSVSLDWEPDSRDVWVTFGEQAARLDTKTGRVSPLENFSNGNQIESFARSPDGDCLLVREGYFWNFLRDNDGTRRTLGQWLGTKMMWLPNGRCFLGEEGVLGYRGFDVDRSERLGTLWPAINDKHWVCIGPDGHYHGSMGIEEHIVVVAMLEDGSQQTFTPQEFAEKFGWKNDPAKARLLKVDP